MLRVVPFTVLCEETVSALRSSATFVRVAGPDDYRRLLRHLWQAGAPFLLVEHDVVPTGAQLDAIEACPEPWCGYGYWPGEWTPLFGCVRFGAAILEGIPEAFSDASWPWGQLDSRFAELARARGFRFHWHSPHVLHMRSPYLAGDAGHREVVRRRPSPVTSAAILEAELASIEAATEGRATGASWALNADALSVLRVRDHQEDLR